MFIHFLFTSLILFLLGASIGSFLNVVMYRSLDHKPRKRGETWFKGRSRCDNCHRQIAWYDNIPLLSFIFLRGRCRSCRTQISLHHPVVEILTGALFVWWYWGSEVFFHLTQTPFGVLQPLFWLGVGLILLYIFLTDAWYYLIPDTAIAALLGVTVIYRLALVVAGIMQPRDLVLAVLSAAGAALALGSVWWVTKGRGMGLGDVKLMIPLGLLLGWPNTLVMLFMAFLTGGVFAVGLLVTHKRSWGQVVPFGPFLIVRACISLIWGEQLCRWYLTRMML